MKRAKMVLACAAALVVLAALAVYLRGANVAVLEPAGPVAAAEKNIILTTAFLCSLIVVPVFILLFYFAWKYRASNADTAEEHHPDWDHDNALAEIFWWVPPALIIAVLGAIAVQSSNALDPYKTIAGEAPPITIDVVALDWKWLFIYPQQGIASVNLVEFPVNTPVHFYLTADAPMNSFWIPQLAGQIMVMPGMTTQLNLAASRTGDFNGFSGNLSGAGFAGMAFTARAVSQSDFNAWLATTASSSSALTPQTYDALAAPSDYTAVTYYAPVYDAFDATMMKYMTPGSSMSMQTDGRSTSSGTNDIKGMDMTP